jgi:recombination protein RecA
MAKKAAKAKKLLDPELSAKEKFAAVRKSVEKEYGAGTALKASEVKTKKKFLVPVSPALDIGLCGGVPSGSWIMMSGPEKSGKSTLALQIVKNAQKLFGCETLFLNVESRFKKQSTTSIEGIDLDKVLVVETTADKIMYAEDYLEVAEEIITNTYGSIIIFDSLSRMYTRAGGDSEVSGTKRPTAQKLMSDFVSRMGGMVAARNHIVICIAQIYANTSGYGAHTVISVPNCIRFQSDIIMHIKRTEPWKAGSGTNETQIGNILDWNIVQNAIGQPPFGLVQSYLKFGVGAGTTEELFNLAVDCMIIEKAGSWFNFSDGSKAQGEAKACQYLEENPEFFGEIRKQVIEHTQDAEVLEDFMTVDETIEQVA